MVKKQLSIVVMMLCLHVLGVTADEAHKTGSLKGIIWDASTKTSVVGANVVLLNSTYGAVSDTNGRYAIIGLPVGGYSVRCSCIGYEPKIITDVIIKSDRTQFLDIELRLQAVAMGEVTVHGGYFSQIEDQPVSAVHLSFEEIRRAPGSAGDVSRILFGLPSIAKVNDQTNHLIVRGGSPIENGYYLDNIEITNINHFPSQGASSGPLSLINVDFINDVVFHAGGFSSLYGDRLSSVMELKFREGDRERLAGQLDLNFAGFGGVFEGPISQKGSWMFSARRSYLDLLVKTIDVGTTITPRYSDYQGKIAYQLNPKNKISLLAVWGDDHNNPDYDTAVAKDMQYYGKQDIYERTTGLNWQNVWGKKGFSQFSLSYTSTRFCEDFNETNTQQPLLRNHSRESFVKMRQVNTLRFTAAHILEFGIESKHSSDIFDNRFYEGDDALGSATKEQVMQRKLQTQKWAAFFNYTIEPMQSITANVGLRYDYFNYNQNGHLSPRGSLTCRISNLTFINMSLGLYYQNLPMVLLAQSENHRTLQDPMSVHYIIGFSHLLSADTKLSIEAYEKRYQHFPVDPTQPQLFLLDEIVYRYAFFSGHESLRSRGLAQSRGIEVILQKKLAKRLYGLACLGVSKSRYRDDDGNWRDRIFDNRFQFSVEGGYKPNASWEFSGRWIYAGGAPYTPLDINKSAALHRDVLDQTRINKARYPDYHSLNIRFDRRFHFQRSNLIFYLSVWNVYNRKNLATYFWNDIENKQDAIYQWGILPVFGLEYEF